MAELSDFQKRIFRFYEDNTFVYYIHAKPVVDEDGQVILSLRVGEEHVNLHGILHGGVLMTLADTSMGAAAMMRNKKVVTMTLSMDFMHAVPLTTVIYARGKVLHDGAHTMTLECEVRDKEGKLYAKAHGTFYVLGHFVEEDD